MGDRIKIHDAWVFSLSLYESGGADTAAPYRAERFEVVDVPLFLVGDSAYSLLICSWNITQKEEWHQSSMSSTTD